MYKRQVLESLKTLLAQFARGVGKIKEFALNGILGAIFLLGSTYFCLQIFQWGINGYLIAFIIANIVSIIYLLWKVDIKSYMDFSLCDRVLLRNMIIYSLPLIPNMLSWWMTNISSRYIIAGYCGLGIAGLFAGASKIPALINVVLDYVFVFPIQMGLTGAALATALAQAVGGLMVLVYLFGFSKTLHLYKLKMSMKSLRLTCRNTGYMIQLGASAMLGELAIACMMLVGNYAFIRMLKEDGVAAYSVACYCLPIVFMIANAIAQSAQPIISYNYGTGDAARVHETFRLSLKTAFISGLTAFAVMYVFCPYIVAMFLEPGCPAYGIATKGIPYFASGFICFALNIAWIGYYQSTELARKAMLFMLLRGIILMSICFLALPHLLGEKGLWAAVPCAELIIFIALTIDYQYRHKICRVVK